MQTIDSRLRLWMSFWLAGAVCVCSLLESRAQTAKPVPPVSNRYLLVVETSRAMQQRLDGMLEVVADLFNSGMAGQLEPHDTIGVWTYDSEVHAGVFPLQDWSPTIRTNIGRSVQAFIRAQKPEKKPKFDKVMPMLQQVVRGSEYITVIIISSGEAPLHGTSFDTRINTFYSTWRSQQQKANMPFVAVLRAQKGQFVDCTVGAAPWHAELPALPAELLAARAARIAAVPKKQTPAALPPLVFTGHKPAPEPVKPAGDKPLTSVPKSADAPAATAEAEPKAARLVNDKITGSTTPSLQPQTLAAAPAANNAQPTSSQFQNVRTQSELTAPAAHATGKAPVEGSASAASTNNPLTLTPATAASLAQSAHSVSTTNVASVGHNPGTDDKEPAATVPSAVPSNSKLLWFSAGLLVVLVALIFRRWREHAKPPVHISVITRSLERERQ